MTLVVIGPVTEDLIIIGDEKSRKIGGATYYQSFVFEKFFKDYLAIVNASDKGVVNDFPDSSKVRVILKEDTHFFINEYPHADNRDIRHQTSNFAEIPIFPEDLKDILPSEIDGFIINPLNRFDFPSETIEFLKSFNVPVFVSIQGFLRVKDTELNENYTIKLENFDELTVILRGVDSIFLDESELNIIGLDYDIDEIVVTNGSKGSRIVNDNEIKIDAVKCGEVVDTTGCGDTYMAAYISQKLKGFESEYCGNFASEIASEKLKKYGHY